MGGHLLSAMSFQHLHTNGVALRFLAWALLNLQTAQHISMPLQPPAWQCQLPFGEGCASYLPAALPMNSGHQLRRTPRQKSRRRVFRLRGGWELRSWMFVHYFPPSRKKCQRGLTRGAVWHCTRNNLLNRPAAPAR